MIGAVVCLLAASRGSSCSLSRAMDGRIVRCGIISSCQSAATSEKVLLITSLTHVRSAIASTRALPLPLRSLDWLSVDLVLVSGCTALQQLCE